MYFGRGVQVIDDVIIDWPPLRNGPTINAQVIDDVIISRNDWPPLRNGPTINTQVIDDVIIFRNDWPPLQNGPTINTDFSTWVMAMTPSSVTELRSRFFVLSFTSQFFKRD